MFYTKHYVLNLIVDSWWSGVEDSMLEIMGNSQVFQLDPCMYVFSSRVIHSGSVLGYIPELYVWICFHLETSTQNYKWPQDHQSKTIWKSESSWSSVSDIRRIINGRVHMKPVPSVQTLWSHLWSSSFLMSAIWRIKDTRKENWYDHQLSELPSGGVRIIHSTHTQHFKTILTI